MKLELKHFKKKDLLMIKDGLTKLLKDRYSNGMDIECPLCEIAKNTKIPGIVEENTICSRCIWNVFFGVLSDNTGYGIAPCNRWLGLSLIGLSWIEFSDLNDITNNWNDEDLKTITKVRKKRIRQIRYWLMKINQHLLGEK